MNEPTLRVHQTLGWMIQTLQYHQRIDDPHPNQAWGDNGVEPNWSPELREAMTLHAEIEAGRLMVTEV